MMTRLDGGRGEVGAGVGRGLHLVEHQLRIDVYGEKVAGVVAEHEEIRIAGDTDGHILGAEEWQRIKVHRGRSSDR